MTNIANIIYIEIIDKANIGAIDVINNRDEMIMILSNKR